MIQNDKEYLEILLELRHKKNSPHLNAYSPSELSYLQQKLDKYEELKGDKDRIGNYMFSFTGTRIWLQDPRPEEVNIIDMAYGLSRINRFNGMSTGEPYSVGQHSIYGSYLIDPKYALHFLLHDGPEYACQDIVTQIKRILGDPYKNMEDKWTDVIAKKYNLEWTDDAIKAVKEMDDKMLATEVDQLTLNRITRMEVTATPYAIEEVDLIEMDWESVYALFVLRFSQLTKNSVCLGEYAYYRGMHTQCQVIKSIHPDLIQG